MVLLILLQIDRPSHGHLTSFAFTSGLLKQDLIIAIDQTPVFGISNCWNPSSSLSKWRTSAKLSQQDMDPYIFWNRFCGSTYIGVKNFLPLQNLQLVPIWFFSLLIYITFIVILGLFLALSCFVPISCKLAILYSSNGLPLQYLPFLKSSVPKSIYRFELTICLSGPVAIFK